MSDKKIHFKLITHERVIYEGDIDELYAQGTEGSFGILPDHTPFMSALAIGVCKIVSSGVADYFAVLGGVLQFSDNHAVILSGDAQNGKDIDAAVAKAEKEKLEARFGTEEYYKDLKNSENALATALAKFKAAMNQY